MRRGPDGTVTLLCVLERGEGGAKWGGPEMGGLKWGPESAHCAAYGCSPHCFALARTSDWRPSAFGIPKQTSNATSKVPRL